MARKMRIAEAKQYVADKLGISVIDLVNEDVMFNLRSDLDIGIVTGEPGKVYGVLAKSKIAKLLEIEINSVNLLKTKL